MFADDPTAPLIIIIMPLSTYFASPFDDATMLIIDGQGDSLADRYEAESVIAPLVATVDTATSSRTATPTA